MRVLVIRMSSIGDVILTTPVIKAFKRRYPDAVVDFLVLKNFKDAITDIDYIDNIIYFDKEKNDGFGNILKFADKLKENRYDYIFDLHSKFRSKLISKKLGVKTYTYKKRSWWKTILVKLRLCKYKVDDTIVKNYFGAFSDFGLEYIGEDLDFGIPRNDFQVEFKNHPVIAPGASKETKKWTVENFGKVAKMIYSKSGKRVLLLGGKEDYQRCEMINEISDNSCINLAGKYNLKQSGKILSESKFLLTNDSGPFHMARGVKCKTFVIFGPTSPEMFEYDENNILLYKGVGCSPCSLHGDKVCPKKHFDCMKKLSAEEVFEIIEKKINWEV